VLPSPAPRLEPDRIEAVVIATQIPAGVLGPAPVDHEVRCFLVAGATGIVLIDAGVPGTADEIDAALQRLGRGWPDVSDIVLTHHHFDHTGGLHEVVRRARRATVSAGAREVHLIDLERDGVVRPLSEGDHVGDLVVLDTPGHTAGHISLLYESLSVVFVGDLVGSVEGALSFGPAAFTADPAESRRSLARVVELGTERIVFSHGPEVADAHRLVRELLAAPTQPSG